MKQKYALKGMKEDLEIGNRRIVEKGLHLF
jgi:hypothetical protein